MNAAARSRPADATTPAAQGGELVVSSLQAALGDALTDIARLSTEALRVADDTQVARQIIAIRQRAVDGLEDLRTARDARARGRLRSRRLLHSLRELTAGFQAQTRIFTELRTPTHELVLPDEIAWALYSVADETLEGLERRSRATGVVMIVRASGEEVSMSIRDDGVGLLARQGAEWRASPHAAVRAMKRAVEAVGGAVSITSARPRGLLVRAVVPLRAA